MEGFQKCLHPLKVLATAYVRNKCPYDMDPCPVPIRYAITIGRRRIGFEYDATVAAIQGGWSTSYELTRQVLTVS